MDDRPHLTPRPSELSPRLGLNIHRGQWPTAPALKAHEAAGFAWVQVHTPPRRMLADREKCRRHARALRAALDTSGLRLLLHAPDELSLGTADHDRAGEGLLDYAAECGAELVAYHGLSYPAAGGGAGRVAAEERALARLARRAERECVVLAVENLAPVYPPALGPGRICHDPLAVRDLVRRIGSPAVGMLLDCGHAHITTRLSGESDVPGVLREVRRDVVLFHLHDNLGARHHDLGAPGVDPLKLDLHLAPGSGSLPWHAIGEALRAHDAPLMLEVEPSHRPELVALAEVTASLLLRQHAVA
jgi:sugar phosphate isomerase/epimerase